MSHYRKGYEAEREMRKILEGKGFKVIRSSRSLTPADLIAGDGEKVLVVQVKSGDSRVSREEREKLMEFAPYFKAVPMLAVKRKGKWELIPP